MGVDNAWKFLSKKGINGDVIRDPLEVLSRQEAQPPIRVDIVGAFYSNLKHHFLSCDPEDTDQLTKASQSFLDGIVTILAKDRSILYLDGKPTVEREYAYTQRISSLLKKQQALESELRDYIEYPTGPHLDKLVKMIRDVFVFTEDMKEALLITAKRMGWNVVRADGEAEAMIGKAGGIVLSQDSDMLFYPGVDTVIKQVGKEQFRVFNKPSLLAKLQLTSNAFTALGILAANDYGPGLFGRGSLVSNDCNIYDTVLGIQRTSNPDLSVKDVVVAYTNKMNEDAKKPVFFECFSKPYRVFVLQEEELLPPYYDIRSRYLYSTFYFMQKLDTI
ncbi:hypothetical protein V8B55DRAFT_1583950 [Mucor lusitanicus]|uniref:XPG-I domain-containing protein n=1 Tax=Mucor lusitanicus CBS 277.49 TaxID=747725 RepID=A0A162TUU0_MUCCL|nr:hypothetical protein MUCCIDRAFT_77705 [Mucor lusitanicus CBS 277.49]